MVLWIISPMKTFCHLSMGVTALLGLAACAHGSSPRITDGPWVSNITRSTALLSWVTDQVSNSTVRWGLKPGSHPYGVTGDGKGLIHSWYVSGAPASSTVYYVVCSSNGADPEICSTEGTFNT